MWMEKGQVKQKGRIQEKEKVQVLLSAYNGEKYIKEQLDSLLAQTYRNVEILVRDDGSRDGTLAILRKYEAEHGNIHVFAGKNIGLVKSFWKLLQMSDADYVAFCDQDDIWMKVKIEAAIVKIEKVQRGRPPGFVIPVLYCGNKILIDADGKEMPGADTAAKKPGFGNALVESICTGCTAVMNRALAEDIKRHIPKHAAVHDWWCYLVASYLGETVYDVTPYLYYRQHGGNQIGGAATARERRKAQAAYLASNRGKLKKQLEEFVRLYHGDKEKDRLAKSVLAAGKGAGRFAILFNRGIYRQRKLDGVAMRFLFLTGRML